MKDFEVDSTLTGLDDVVNEAEATPPAADAEVEADIVEAEADIAEALPSEDVEIPVELPSEDVDPEDLPTAVVEFPGDPPSEFPDPPPELSTEDVEAVEDSTSVEIEVDVPGEEMDNPAVDVAVETSGNDVPVTTEDLPPPPVETAPSGEDGNVVVADVTIETNDPDSPQVNGTVPNEGGTPPPEYNEDPSPEKAVTAAGIYENTVIGDTDEITDMNAEIDGGKSSDYDPIIMMYAKEDATQRRNGKSLVVCFTLFFIILAATAVGLAFYFVSEFYTSISSVEIQKGVITFQWCSVKNQNGAIAVQSLYGDSTLLVFNSNYSTNTLLVLSRWSIYLCEYMYQLINIHVKGQRSPLCDSVRRHGDVGLEFNKTRRSIRSASPNYVERSDFLSANTNTKRTYASLYMNINQFIHIHNNVHWI